MNSFILWHRKWKFRIILALFWKILQPWLTSEPGVESVSFRPQQAACLQCSATGFKHFVKSGDIMMLLENYASFHSHEAWNYLAPTGKFCAKQAALLKTQFTSKWLDIICSNDTCFLAHRHQEEQLDAQELLMFRSGWQRQHEKRAKGQRLNLQFSGFSSFIALMSLPQSN